MKTLKCPLCGEELAPSVQRYGFEYVCWKCKWQTASLCSTRQEAEKTAQKLISKFPPIMRVWPRDKVLCGSRPSPVTIVSKNIERGEIKIRDSHRTYFIIDCDDVLAWPWEFEQKGGDNGQ